MHSLWFRLDDVQRSEQIEIHTKAAEESIETNGCNNNEIDVYIFWQKVLRRRIKIRNEALFLTTY